MRFIQNRGKASQLAIIVLQKLNKLDRSQPVSLLLALEEFKSILFVSTVPVQSYGLHGLCSSTFHGDFEKVLTNQDCIF